MTWLTIDRTAQVPAKRHSKTLIIAVTVVAVAAVAVFAMLPAYLFTLHDSSALGFDRVYAQADAWLPVKADDVPLSQFIAEVQAA